VNDLVEFLKKEYEPANTWSDESILEYLKWAASNDFLFIARNDDGSIIGAALARPVSGFPETLFEFDRNSKTVHVNFLVASDKRAFLLLGFAVLQGFERATFNRLKKGRTKPKSYPANLVRKTLFNFRNYGQRRQ